MPSLIPRPAVKRVNRTIIVPNAVKTATKLTKQRIIPSRPIQKGIIDRRIIKQATVQPKPTVDRKTRNSRRTSVIEWKGARSRHGSTDITSTPQNIAAITNLRGVGRGRILVIVGNGPSLNEVDLGPLKQVQHIDIMSINKPVANVWPTSYWLFCDVSQYKRHTDLWEGYTGTIINTKAVPYTKPRCVKLKSIHGRGFSFDMMAGVHVGRSSVYVAMQVALWMEYEHVYIFGIDMSVIWKDGAMITHFFGVNPDVKPDIRAKRFDEEATHYDNASKIMSKDERQKFTFCSSLNPYEFVGRFQRLDHKTAVQSILDVVALKY